MIQEEGFAMRKQPGKIRDIRREVRGKACPFCGGQKYQLVLRASCTEEEPGLFVRCSQCHHPRTFDDNFANVLWV